MVAPMLIHTLVHRERIRFGVNPSLSSSRNPLTPPEVEGEVIGSDYMMPSPGGCLLSFYKVWLENGCRGHSKLHLQRGMGSIHRFDRRLLPYSYTRKVSTSKISCGRQNVPVPGSSIRHCYGSPRVLTSCERGTLR